ncbi:angiotensin II receptor associated protein [Homo sapiens]|uniref:Angiotensin II receptor associated protein n=1 Tax=Homo sapiens TaxID=9606 RepID=D6RBK6_HUMAN|nr:angiotensin II receptor associated protein [Homo sapiens]KAI4078634.1 angiotensin II receptor associated protein [Homo sapiens]
MELPAVNLKVILLGHWLLTTCFWVACWPPSSWTSCTSASSTRGSASRTRAALAWAWPSSACCSSRSPAASSTTCTGSAGVSSWSTLVSLGLLRTVVPTRRLTQQRRPQIPLQSQRAGVKMPEGTEASHAAPGPAPGLPRAWEVVLGMLLTSVSWT